MAPDCEDCCGPATQSGFSLVETIVAMTILSMITVVVSAALKTGLQYTLRSHERENARANSVAIEVLDGLVRDTAHPNAFQPFQVMTFRGTPDSVSFVSGADVAGRRGGFSKISLRLQPSGSCHDQQDLVLQWSDIRNAGQPELSDRRALIGCLESAAFDYFGYRVATGERTWQSQWLEYPDLPLYVRLHLKKGDSIDMIRLFKVKSGFYFDD